MTDLRDKKLKFYSKMNDFRLACISAGLKLTHQRTEIFKELAKSDNHPDARQIYQKVSKKIPSISFDTVYRTLRTFDEKGLISMVGVWCDRQKFDANKEKHYHFVCLDCGMILDISEVKMDNLAIPKEAFKLGVPKSLHIEVRGKCSKCVRKNKAQKK